MISVVDSRAVADGRFADDDAAIEAQRQADENLDHESPLEELFEKIEHLVPMQLHGLSISGRGKQLEAEFNSIASLELQITMDGLRLATKVERNKCKIQAHNFGGCFSCLTGARLEFTCNTDFGEAVAHVQCGSKAAFSTVCSPQGVKATASLNFQQADVQEEQLPAPA